MIGPHVHMGPIKIKTRYCKDYKDCATSIKSSYLHSKLTDVHLRSFSEQIESFLALFRTYELGIGNCNCMITILVALKSVVWCTVCTVCTEKMPQFFVDALVPKAFQKYKVPATLKASKPV